MNEMNERIKIMCQGWLARINSLDVVGLVELIEEIDASNMTPLLKDQLSRLAEERVTKLCKGTHP